ncbi:hypothetical protein CEXT_121961 [Caerostris extrusa]|uniref:Uncharacterized protein n=1 Tax=Caerostris extrusa TaxID=172846 RepID=A0AAV4P5K1_CAEEX|nr:hypothetical protein CEXT_121961 [Caerostris extrusa]
MNLSTTRTRNSLLWGRRKKEGQTRQAEDFLRLLLSVNNIQGETEEDVYKYCDAAVVVAAAFRFGFVVNGSQTWVSNGIQSVDYCPAGVQ